MKNKHYISALLVGLMIVGCNQTEKQSADAESIAKTASTTTDENLSREDKKTKAASIPDKIQTVAGELEFFDGVPIGNTNDLVYDYLNRARGVDVYLDNIGAVSIYSVLAGMAEQGADAPNKIAIWQELMDSRTPVITSNTSTMYAYGSTDLANDGPTVIEIPPGMLGFLDDAWQRFVGNMGVTGPDKGKGGKYLLLPPGYTGDVPEGYFILKPKTATIRCLKLPSRKL